MNNRASDRKVLLGVGLSLNVCIQVSCVRLLFYICTVKQKRVMAKEKVREE